MNRGRTYVVGIDGDIGFGTEKETKIAEVKYCRSERPTGVDGRWIVRYPAQFGVNYPQLQSIRVDIAITCVTRINTCVIPQTNRIDNGKVMPMEDIWNKPTSVIEVNIKIRK